MLYTVEVRKQDKRVKSGLRYVDKFDVEAATKMDAHREAIARMGLDYVYSVYETYVTRKNLLTGKEYQERYDRPHYCSPSSETYWSM